MGRFCRYSGRTSFCNTQSHGLCLDHSHRLYQPCWDGDAAPKAGKRVKMARMVMAASAQLTLPVLAHQAVERKKEEAELTAIAALLAKLELSCGMGGKVSGDGGEAIPQLLKEALPSPYCCGVFQIRLQKQWLAWSLANCLREGFCPLGGRFR